MKTGWLLTLAVAAAAGAGAYYYWHQQGPGRLDIQTAEVKRGDVRRVVSTSGTVSALVTVDIGSQLSGNIGAVNVDRQQAGMGRAEANLHKAERDLGRAKELVAKGATSQAALDTAIAAEQG